MSAPTGRASKFASQKEGPLRRASLFPGPELPLPALRAEHQGSGATPQVGTARRTGVYRVSSGQWPTDVRQAAPAKNPNDAANMIATMSAAAHHNMISPLAAVRT
jgi:hypothetical protein